MKKIIRQLIIFLGFKSPCCYAEIIDWSTDVGICSKCQERTDKK